MLFRCLPIREQSARRLFLNNSKGSPRTADFVLKNIALWSDIFLYLASTFILIYDRCQLKNQTDFLLTEASKKDKSKGWGNGKLHRCAFTERSLNLECFLSRHNSKYFWIIGFIMFAPALCRSCLSDEIKTCGSKSSAQTVI